MTKLEKIVPQEFQVSEWSGGKTTQIMIDPPGALYADRDFYFRLSSATVELEESNFTSLPDYNRIIAPIEGELSLYYNGSEEPAVLHELECAAFDGSWETRSRGKVEDYNLMTRKGICQGNAFALIVGVGQRAEFSCESNEKGRSVLLIWCVQGSAELSTGRETVLLSPRDAARLQLASTEAAVKLMVQNTGTSPVRLMVAQVSFLS
ncbi:HutD/Ves family protein [Faecalispora anaeroviscerum]|uniref:HutD/Ves family protein n=1 Tax=Faecalispora anaeroviscerum TaxID=2991836 RepID=UPI0024BB7DB6|nr:HutD family protein [Faecalispora anaeroviscerum]